jgi:hypothetical protein
MNSRIAGALPVCLLLFAPDALAQDAVDLAASLIGRPYVWGAEGPDSFDCSGLTQYVYQHFGVELPRRAIHQSTFGDGAGRRLQRGDLLFFSSDTRRSAVTHVGLYEGNGVMIDASKRHGRVRRDDLSDPYWAERLMFARRVRPSAATGERSIRRGDSGGDRLPGSDGRRRAAITVLRGAAEILLDIRRRR